MRFRIPGRSTIKLMMILSGSIFVSELIIDQLLPHFLNAVGWVKAIADSSLLILVTFPFLYFFAFRPLKNLTAGLRESEEAFRNTFDHAAVGIAHISSKGTFLHLNDRWCEIVGYTHEELVTMSFQDLIHPDDLHGSLLQLQPFIEDGNRFSSSEKRYLRKDKSIVWVNLTASIVNEPSGVPKYFISVIEDVTERKRTEAALHESENKLNVILESTADGILAVDAKGKVLRTNKRFAELWQIPQSLIDSKGDDALLNHVLSQLVEPEAFLSKVRLLYDSADEDRDILRFKDGRTFERYSAPIVMNGETSGRVWSFRDVTERKRADQQIADALHYSQTIFEASTIGIITYTESGQAISVNRAASTIIGTTVECLRNQNFRELDSWKQSGLLEAADAALASGDSKDVEVLHVTTFGKEVWLSARFVPFMHQGRKELLVLFSNITERKRSEEALRESEERYRSIIHASPDNITIADLKGRIIMVSPIALSMFGFERKDLARGLSITDFIVPEDRNRAMDNIALKLQGVTARSNEYRGLRMDGSTLDIEVNSEFIRGTDGRPKEIVIIVRDITTRKEADEKKIELERRLLQAQKLESIGTLAGGIAHDFNNVLGGIMGYTEMSLKYTEKDSKLERNLLKVLIATDRAKHLIEQILTFSRKTNPQKSITSIRPVIKEVLDLLRASIPSSVIIESDLQKNAKPVTVDPTKIHEALLNLATNAVHAMDRKGTMTIRLYAECLDRTVHGQAGEIAPGEYTVIEVADTGCGMDTITLSKAFEPFFTTKAVGEGTGMGLSVVLGVVQSLGGDIQVESEKGKGTSFKLYLPVAEESVSGAGNQESLVQLYGTERILFVDDEQMLADMAKEMLTPLGYSVVGICNSLEALNYLKEKGSDIDILITDQTMPGMTGIELAKEALKIRRNIPIILCTGFSNELNPERAASIGVNQLLMKPYAVSEIGKAIRKIFDNRK